MPQNQQTNQQMKKTRRQTYPILDFGENDIVSTLIS